MEADGTEQVLAITKKMAFKDRKSVRCFLQDFALRQGKRIVVDKKLSGGKSIIFRCSSTTPCSFEVRVLKSKKADVQGYFVSSFVLDHHGCTGHAKPTTRQISEVAAARAAVSANPKASANALISQVQETASVSCSKRMMYRARDQINDDKLGDYATNFQKIESLLEEFSKANPGCHQVFERDETGRYKRAFLSNPIVSRHIKHGQRVLGIDGAFMKHGVYKEVMLVLVGRTGNNTNVELAVALCGSEDEGNCRWFLNNAKTAGIHFEGIPVFTDRGSGILAAFETCKLGCMLRFCTRHIVGNVLKNFNGHVPADLKTMVYRIQGAESEDEYKSHLLSLGLTHSSIAEYLDAIPADKWLMHPATVQATKLYGWRTTNFVESANGAAIPSRLKFPLQFFESFMDKWMSQAFQLQELGNRWKRQGRKITAYGESIVAEQQKLAASYTVHPKSSDVHFVRSVHGAPLQRVDLDAKTCTCSFMRQYGLPCRHFIASLTKSQRNEELYDACDPCYSVQSFLDGYGCDAQGVELVLDHQIQLREVPPPIATLNSVGRKKTKRIPSHQEIPSSTPAAKVRKCTLCGEVGHNRRSCLTI